LSAIYILSHLISKEKNESGDSARQNFDLQAATDWTTSGGRVNNSDIVSLLESGDASVAPVSGWLWVDKCQLRRFKSKIANKS